MYMKRKDQAMLAICNAFQLEGAAVSCVPYGSGHINATYLVKTDADPISCRKSMIPFSGTWRV